MLITLGMILRLLPHPPNVAPIAALGLFGGVYLNKKYAIFIPLTAMFVSDLFLGFHSLIPWVYGSFTLVGLIGIWLRKKRSPGNVVIASLASSILFYLITNLGVWLEGKLYPPTLSGLVMSYYMAIPFFRNTIIGDLLYTGIFFGAYELANQLSHKYQTLYTKYKIH